MGGIWLWGVEAGVGGFRSPPSAMELLVDWGVWGPWRDPEPAAGRRTGERHMDEEACVYRLWESMQLKRLHSQQEGRILNLHDYRQKQRQVFLVFQ